MDFSQKSQQPQRYSPESGRQRRRDHFFAGREALSATFPTPLYQSYAKVDKDLNHSCQPRIVKESIGDLVSKQEINRLIFKRDITFEHFNIFFQRYST